MTADLKEKKRKLFPESGAYELDEAGLEDLAICSDCSVVYNIEISETCPVCSARSPEVKSEPEEEEKIVCPGCHSEYAKADLMKQELEGGILRNKGYYCQKCDTLLLDEKGGNPEPDELDWDT